MFANSIKVITSLLVRETCIKDLSEVLVFQLGPRGGEQSHPSPMDPEDSLHAKSDSC